MESSTKVYFTCSCFIENFKGCLWSWKELNFLPALYANRNWKYRAIEKFLKVPQITFPWKHKSDTNQSLTFRTNSCRRIQYLFCLILSRFQNAIAFCSFTGSTLHYMRRLGLPAGAGNTRGMGWALQQDSHFGLQDVCSLVLLFWGYF